MEKIEELKKNCAADKTPGANGYQCRLCGKTVFPEDGQKMIDGWFWHFACQKEFDGE